MSEKFEMVDLGSASEETKGPLASGVIDVLGQPQFGYKQQ